MAKKKLGRPKGSKNAVKAPASKVAARRKNVIHDSDNEKEIFQALLLLSPAARQRILSVLEFVT